MRVGFVKVPDEINQSGTMNQRIGLCLNVKSERVALKMLSLYCCFQPGQGGFTRDMQGQMLDFGPRRRNCGRGGRALVAVQPL